MSNISINILDYVSNPVLSGFALNSCPFTFTSSVSNTNYLFLWDFGDGTTSPSISATHTYLWEGVYNIKLSVTDTAGSITTNTLVPTLSIYNFVNNKLSLNQTSTPFYNVPAGSIIEGIRVNRFNSWQFKQDGYTLIPYVSGSLGNYLDINVYNSDEWSHLNCNDKFYTITTINNVAQYIPTNSYTTIDTSLYATVSNSSVVFCNSAQNNSFYVGTSGYVDVFFTSDIPKNYSSTDQPIILFLSQDYSQFNTQFTQDTSYYNSISGLQYLNTQPIVLPTIKVRNNTPTQISFSTTGIDTEGIALLSSFNIPTISWQNTPIPFIIRLKDQNRFNTKFYPLLSATNINQSCDSLYNNLSVILVDSTNTLVPSVSFYTDYIPATDFSQGGYFKGYFICPSPVSNCTLSALVVVQNTESFDLDTIGCSLYNPADQTLYHNIYTLQYNSLFQTLCSDYINRQITTSLSGVLNNTSLLSATAPVYVSPITTGAYKKMGYWLIDENANYIYCFDILGNTIRSLDLNNTYYQGSLTNFITSSQIPGITTKYAGAVDINNNFWVSLFGSGNVIKYNNLFKNIDTITSPIVDYNTTYPISAIPGYIGQSVVSSTSYTPFLSAINNFIPISINTDSSNNLWVGYTIPLDPYHNGLLVKYTATGNIVKQLLLPQLSIPRQIVVDKDDNINIVLDLYTNTPTTIICRYNNEGTLVATVSTLSTSLPSLLSETATSDTFGTLHYYDTTQNIITTLSADNNYSSVLSVSNIEGIFADTYNKVSYINTALNKISVSDSTTYEFPFSLSATRGDISGFNFINKFYHTRNEDLTIAGQSNVFNIIPPSGNYYIGKINEDFDANSYYNSLRFQENLLDKGIFFNSFLGTITGNVSSDYTSLGKGVYEKIANFVDNNADVDKSNITSLLSQCTEFSVPYENINYQFPPNLQKLIDLLSINFNQLKGTQNNFALDFNKRNSLYSKFGINLGSQISVFTDTISLSEKVVAYERYSNTHKLVQSALVTYTDTMTNTLSVYPSSTVLPLSTFSQTWGWGLVLPPSLSGIDVHYYYDFYRYLEGTSTKYYDNTINWDDILTTASLSSMSYNDWVESSGIMDQLISQRLVSGLNLLT